LLGGTTDDESSRPARFVQAVKLWINKAKDRLRQGDYGAIRGQGKRPRSRPELHGVATGNILDVAMFGG
jgi:hypothetical protein